jgi:hypothetical protein
MLLSVGAFVLLLLKKAQKNQILQSVRLLKFFFLQKDELVVKFPEKAIIFKNLKKFWLGVGVLAICQEFDRVLYKENLIVAFHDSVGKDALNMDLNALML